MKKILSVVLIGTLLFMLAGCQKSATSGTGGDESKDVATATREVVVYYPNFGRSYNGEEDTSSIMAKTKEAFEKQYSDVSIVLHPVEDGMHYMDLVQQDIDAGKPIDVFVTWDQQFTTFVNDNFLLPLDEYIEANQEYFDNVFDSETLKKATVNDKIYGLPFASVTQGLYYNKNIMEKYNINLNPNWTWDDFYTICEAISKQDKIFPQQQGMYSMLSLYINGRGTNLYSEDGKTSNLTNPIILDGIHFMTKINKLNAFYSTNDAMTELNKGDFAFMPGQVSLSQYKSLVNQYPNIDLINFPVEGENGFIRSTSVYGGVYKNSKAVKEAFDYIKLMVGKDLQAEASQSMGFNTVNKEALRDISKTIPEDKLAVFDILFKRSKSLNDTQQTQTANRYIYSMIFSAMQRESEITAEDLKEMDGQVNLLLNTEPSSSGDSSN